MLSGTLLSLSECRSSPRRSTILLRLHPPAQPSVLAGDYAFSLEATSRRPRRKRDCKRYFLRLAAVSALSLTIQPQRVIARHGVFEVSLLNAGNSSESGAAAHRPG